MKQLKKFCKDEHFFSEGFAKLTNEGAVNVERRAEESRRYGSIGNDGESDCVVDSATERPTSLRRRSGSSAQPTTRLALLSLLHNYLSGLIGEIM